MVIFEVGVSSDLADKTDPKMPMKINLERQEKANKLPFKM